MYVVHVHVQVLVHAGRMRMDATHNRPDSRVVTIIIDMNVVSIRVGDRIQVTVHRLQHSIVLYCTVVVATT
jgi:uncharacterized Fe-S cluster-containing radical SAM superfamily enzyme